eukprot:4765845-Prymnesium_polylepis.2
MKPPNECCTFWDPDSFVTEHALYFSVCARCADASLGFNTRLSRAILTSMLHHQASWLITLTPHTVLGAQPSSYRSVTLGKDAPKVLSHLFRLRIWLSPDCILPRSVRIMVEGRDPLLACDPNDHEALLLLLLRPWARLVRFCRGSPILCFVLPHLSSHISAGQLALAAKMLIEERHVKTAAKQELKRGLATLRLSERRLVGQHAPQRVDQ